MSTYVFSATQLNSYLYYRANAETALAHEKYVSELTRGFAPNEAMRAGTAFHDLMEAWAEGCTDDRVGYDDAGNSYLFYFSTCYDGFDFEMPDDVEYRRMMQIDDDLILSGKYDARVGNKIIDYKTSSKAPVLSRHADSIQWKVYLTLIPFCNCFEYQCVTIKKARCLNRDEDQAHYAYYQVMRQQSLLLYSYPGMHTEVFRTARSLKRFCVQHGITPEMLPRRI